MKNYFMGLIVGVIVLAFSAVGLAQVPPQAGAAGAKAIPRTLDGKPDLSGIWRTVSSKVEPMQLTVWATKRWNYNKLPEGNGARPEYDPILHCYRPGLARLGPPLLVPADSIVVRIEGADAPAPGGPAAMDAVMINYAPRKVWVVYQYNQEVREIFTDGRKHPAVDPEDNATLWWNGYSTGTWDGDTFVVDTTNLRNETWLDNLGHEFRQLHIVERFRRVDADTLQIDRTLTDPMALAKPYTTSATLKLTPNLTFQENVVCGQYYVRKFAFGYDGLLGINTHPWQGEDRSSAIPEFSGRLPDEAEKKDDKK